MLAMDHPKDTLNTKNGSKSWNPFQVSVDPSVFFKPKFDVEPKNEDFEDNELLCKLNALKIDDKDFDSSTNSTPVNEEEESKSVHSETSSNSNGSETSEDTAPSKSVTLYKTEMCDTYISTGYCRYKHKCKFAHGFHELRPVPRHPKYKSILCKNFWENGYCPYGKRCCFLHKTMSEAEIITFNVSKAESTNISTQSHKKLGGNIEMFKAEGIKA